MGRGIPGISQVNSLLKVTISRWMTVERPAAGLS